MTDEHFDPIIRDRSDHTGPQQDLWEDDATYRALVEYSLAGVYVIQNDRYVYVNPKLADIFGYTQSELRALPNVVSAVRKDDRGLAAEQMRKRLESDTSSVHYTFRTRHKQGHWLDIEVHGARTELHGKPAIIGTMLDITAKKRAEEQQQALVTELQEALARVTTLSGLLPICAWCKRVRDDTGYWSQVEKFVADRTDAEFSHGVCPDCEGKLLEKTGA